MSHRNARLTPLGRLLLVERIRAGMPVAHAAKAMGVSRQCAYKWLRRFDAEGDDGLRDRSSRPLSCARQTPAAVEEAVIAARLRHRRGPDWLAWRTGVPARTVTAILRRRGLPGLRDLDPMTGALIRSSKAAAVRYERDRPGELVHVDVKKLGRIPDGGGWRAHGRAAAPRSAGGGFDFAHSAVDDHSRLAYSEVLADEKGTTCAGFMQRAAACFAVYGIGRIERVLTDNALAYRASTAFAAALTELGAAHKRTRPYRPQTNGKVERFNRTLQTEWAYRRVYTDNHQRTAALTAWLHHYNHHRPHHALAGHPPIHRLSPTQLPSTPRM